MRRVRSETEQRREKRLLGSMESRSDEYRHEREKPFMTGSTRRWLADGTFSFTSARIELQASVFMAMSVDGCIAPAGGLDWLPTPARVTPPAGRGCLLPETEGLPT